MRFPNQLLLIAVLLSFCGCRVFRNIEQWKCDNMGMCHFGITPTAQSMAPPASIPFQNPPVIYQSAPMGNSVQVFPQSSPMVPQTVGVPANSSNCAQCQK